MSQVLDFFRKLFDTSDWPPRWHCGNWTTFHGWLYIISDLLIWSAYFAIPLFILKYISRKVNAQFVRLYFLFAAFILACGSTHLLDAITFWYPAYRLNALVRFITGVVSWVTVFQIIKLLPVATSLKTHDQLEKEIRDRERAEEELRIANTQLNEAQEIAKMGHWQWNVENDKVEWSDGLFKINGLAPTANVLDYGKVLGMVHPEDRELYQTSVNRALNTKVYTPFLYRAGQDGDTRIMQARGNVVTDAAGTVKTLTGTVQDVTDQFSAQQQLLAKTVELENTNIELQRFAYIASHDLQEPLRKILTFASLLERELAGHNTEKGAAYMEKIIGASTRMQHLIDDVLHFSALQKEALVLEPVNLNACINQVLSDLEVLITETGATVHTDTFPEIEGVASQLTQLFQNLISNAIKFRKTDTPPVIQIKGETISGEVVAARYGDDRFLLSLQRGFWQGETFLQITVQDNGIGFDPAYAQKIFELFQRLHHHSTYEGTGIGLAICKRIVEQHRGAIRAAGTINEGSLFTIILPVSQRSFS